MNLAEAFALQEAIESQRPDLDVTITANDVMVFIETAEGWMPVPSEEHWQSVRRSIEAE